MLTICHLYPELLNLYGDRGNIIAFIQRCRWRGIPVKLKEVSLGESVDLEEVDFLFLGGGSDREQEIISEDLYKRRCSLIDAVESGVVILAICGGYQLLGRYYRTLEGQEIPGLNILDFYTVAGQKRLFGNVVVKVVFKNKSFLIVGFENHSGQTFLSKNIEPLGKVLVGYGNNEAEGNEGARYKNVFCSYLHGPLLPKNVELTDLLISLALLHKGMDGVLEPLDDSLENQAREVMLKRII